MKEIEKLESSILDFLRENKGIARTDEIAKKILGKAEYLPQRRELIRQIILFLRQQDKVEVLIAIVGELIVCKTTEEIKKIKFKAEEVGSLGIDEIELDEFFYPGPFYCFYVRLKD